MNGRKTKQLKKQHTIDGQAPTKSDFRRIKKDYKNK